MDPDHPPTPADVTVTFEHELSDLVLAAFGRGAAIEAVWEIDAPVSDAPNWRVTIEKIPPAAPSYEPTFLEE